MHTSHHKLKAFTLTELLVVLAIIGILVLLAIPILDPILVGAKETEADLQLSHIKKLQIAYRAAHSEYSTDFKALRFQAPPLEKDGGTSIFEYEIVSASTTEFVAKAKCVVDFDGDGQYLEKEIRQDGKILLIVED